jgi:hypothetical protein
VVPSVLSNPQAGLLVTGDELLKKTSDIVE